jgi:Zn finger protein HypA/HybF involved in hydrogenase expression
MIKKNKAQIEKMNFTLHCKNCNEDIWFIPSADYVKALNRSCPTCGAKLKIEKEKKNG